LTQRSSFYWAIRYCQITERERKRGTKIKRRKNVKEEGTVKNCGENETVRHREEKRRK